MAFLLDPVLLWWHNVTIVPSQLSKFIFAAHTVLKVQNISAQFTQETERKKIKYRSVVEVPH